MDSVHLFVMLSGRSRMGDKTFQLWGSQIKRFESPQIFHGIMIRNHFMNHVGAKLFRHKKFIFPPSPCMSAAFVVVARQMHYG